MKKSLSLLLAFALVFSMFSSLAFAADSTSVADKLVNAGIIKGTKSGDLKENETWKRQDVTVIIARLLGKEAEAQNTAKNHSFADVKDLYYDGFITYAYENGYFTGHSDIRFGYGEDITVKQFVAVMLRVLGYDVEWDEVEEVAVEVGLAPANTDFNKAATRGEYFVIIDSTLQTEVAEGGQTLGEKLGLEGYVDEKPDAATEITSVTAVGAKKLEVKFNGSAEGATFSLKKGAMIVAIDETTFNENKTVATITAADKFTQGTYTVTVDGIEGLSVKSKDVTVTNEEITSIELTGEVLPKSNKTPVGLIVKNQYGEEMEVQAGSLTWVYSTALVQSAHDGTKAYVNIDDSLKEDSLVTITVVSNNGKQANRTYKIGAPAIVTTISLTEVVLDDNDAARLTAGGSATVKYDARDQYGNKIDTLDMINHATDTSKQVRLVSNASANIEIKWQANSSDATKADLKINVKNTLLVDETVVLTAVTPAGNSNSITFQAFKAPTIDTVTLAGPTSVVAAGDENVYLGLSVNDQFGTAMSGKQVADAYAAVTDPDKKPIKAFVASTSVTIDNITVETAAGDNQGKLKLGKVNGSGTVTITVVSATGKSSNVTFDVQPKRYAAKIQFHELGATKLLQAANTTTMFKIYDQYGAEFTKDDPDNKVNIALTKVSGDDNGLTLSTSGDVVDETNLGTLTLTAAADKKGEYKLTVKIVSNDGQTTFSTISQNFIVTDGKADSDKFTYAVADIPTLWEGGATNTAYREKISVTATDVNGTKVAIPSSTIISITSSNTSYAVVDTVNQQVYGVKKGTIILTLALHTPNGTEIVTKDVTVSDEAPVAKELKVAKTDVTLPAAKIVDFFRDGDFKVEVVDQYGKTSALTINNEVDFVIVNKTDGTVFTDNNTGQFAFASGKEYTVTVVTKNGLKATINVKVN